MLYICIYVAPWSCEARHLVPLYVHTCSGMTIKLNLNLNILILYLILTICTHKHYPSPLRSSRPQTQVYKPPFPVFFSQFVDFPPLMNNTCSYMIKDPCAFSVWSIWAFINNAKHRHLEFLLLIPMEKNNFMPSSCISHHSNDVMCKQPIATICNK